MANYQSIKIKVHYARQNVNQRAGQLSLLHITNN